MALLQHARESGRCPPSLLSAGEVQIDDRFEEIAISILDATMPGLGLSTDANVVNDYAELLQMAESALKIPGDLDPDMKKSVLEYRRCVLLEMVGSTPSTNPQLKLILSNGALVTVKSWLGDIVNGTFGGIDLLLHLLSSITELPVTKSVVVESGLGKAVGALEKNKICVGSPNEVAIRERVQRVKDAWNASVKANKETSAAKKRALDAAAAESPSKKAKTEAPSKKSSSFSSLLNKVSTSGSSKSSAKDTASKKDNSKLQNGSTGNGVAAQKVAEKKKEAPKKAVKRVKWADHFGGALSSSRLVNREEFETSAPPDESDADVSWTDRKKRDRLREKELLAQAKKAKLADDDEDDAFMSNAVRMKPTMLWHPPKPLPPRSEITPAQLDSKELNTQTNRMSTVAPAQYASESDVPPNPIQMSDVEQALDVAAKAAAVLETIPFFIAQQPAPAPAVAPAPVVPTYSAPVPAVAPPVAAPMPAMTMPPGPATAEMVQAMGLPLFLVGCNVQALQTLSSTPSLLSTFVDANGMYDQPRLMSLVQTLSQSFPAVQATAGGYQQQSYTQPITYGAPQTYQQPMATQATSYGTYAPATTAASTYGSTAAAPAGGFRGKSDAGNLHVSGYGPMTTQTDIVALFAPYVKVDEVVMKATFSFVNTSDPDGANRAREALQGAMLGGSSIRINPATRRAKTDTPAITSLGGITTAGITAAIVNPAATLPRDLSGQIDVASVRDDRGNPATKNLFVAGYGSGTTEQELQTIFGQHAVITGVKMKGAFSFVNTSDRSAAVLAREALMGSIVNGGALRINFAKETGRLGTSFDEPPPSSTATSYYMRNPVH